MFSKQLLHSSIVRLSLIAIVLCSITLLGAQSTGQAKAASQSVPNAPSGQIFINCTVNAVGVNYVNNTVSVHSTDCSPSTGAILYFVVPADSKKANQVLSIALTARATGQKVSMIYDPDDTTGIIDVANNRKLLTIGTP